MEALGMQTGRPVRRLLPQSRERGSDGEPHWGHRVGLGSRGGSRNILEVIASGPKRMGTEKT